MTEIELLHEQIRECGACRAAGFQIEPPPLVWGAAPAPFMLVGQAPSKTDRQSKHMYVGPAAQKLRGWLMQAGFTEEDFGTALYMTALTKCFPGRLPGKSTDRAPTARELNLCAGWLEKQIQIVRPKAIILFGKMAIDRYLGPGPMTERIGESFEKDDRIFIPLPHSSGASTWLNYSENRIRLEAAIDVVRQTRISLTR